MREEWPEDPSDPRCPECGEPVSATSSFCMHCEADLPAAGFGTGRADSGWSAVAPASEGPAAAADAATPSTHHAAPSASGSPPNAGGRDERGWLHPDSVLDDVSTGMVAVVTGVLAGLVATGLVLFALPDVWPFAVGVVVWLLATAWVARTRTVFGAVRKGGYLVGGLVAALPVLLGLTMPFQEDAVGERLTGVVVFGVFTWPIALAAAGVGFAAGAWAHDDAEQDA